MKSKFWFWSLLSLLILSVAANALLFRSHLELRGQITRQQEVEASATVLRSIELLARLKQGEDVGSQLADRWESEADSAAEYLFRIQDLPRPEKAQHELMMTLEKYVLMRTVSPFKPLAFSDWKKTGVEQLDAIASVAQSRAAAQRQYLEDAIRAFTSKKKTG
jgi:hypothetical protein